MLRTWSQSDLAFLRANYKKLSYAEIGERIGKTAGQVKSQASNIGITTTREWPEEHLDILKRDYATKSAAAIGKELGRHFSAVHGMANKLGLKKGPEWYASEASGRGNLAKGTQTRFERGLTPWNKGKKGVCGDHPNCRKTQFKSGQRPHNSVPVGTEVVSTDGYRKIKVAEPNVWEFVHRREWEKVNGAIPKGMMIRFRDGDHMNCSIENLMLITRTEHALYNSQWDIPHEVVPALAALSDLKRGIKTVRKREEVTS